MLRHGSVAHRMFDAAAVWAIRTGSWVRLVSANDHQHSRESLHYEDAAVDFWSGNLDGLAAFLRRFGYRVIWRAPGHWAHVHSEGG